MSNFQSQLLEVGKRLDARSPSQHRQIQISLEKCGSIILVKHGPSIQVSCKIIGSIGAPLADRPSEGTFSLQVYADFPSKATSPLSACLEHLYREGKALELNSLCIIPASKVWNLRAEIRILDWEKPHFDDFGLLHAASIALLAALQHYKRPEIAVMHDSEGRCHLVSKEIPTVSLGFKQSPVAVRMAWNPHLECPLADPTASEALELSVPWQVLAVNGQREILGTWNGSSGALKPEAMLSMANSAVMRGLEIVEQVKQFVSQSGESDLMKKV